MKILINKCYGGWGLSDQAFEKYLDLKGIEWYKDVTNSGLSSQYFPVGIKDSTTKESLWDHDIERTDPILIQVVEELGELASSGQYSVLKIVEVPDDVEWEIEEYDGSEWVAEKHRKWY